MTRSKLLSPLLVGFLISAGAPPVGALPKERKKLPSPAKHLAKIYKSFRKQKSYRVTTSIQGGVSTSADHSLATRTVNQTYDASVYKSLMEVSAPKAYRMPNKGVVKADGRWKTLLSQRKGKLMERLFSYPESVLGRAITKGSKAEWVEEKVDEDTSSLEDDEDDGEATEEETDKQDKKKPKGRTAVRKSRDEAVKLPTVIRVEAPPKEALAHFKYVEESGCISGG